MTRNERRPTQPRMTDGETPEQTLERRRWIRLTALERDRLAVIDMTLVAADLVDRGIRGEFDRQNGV